MFAQRITLFSLHTAWICPPPPHTHIKIHIRFFHAFPQPRYLMWKKLLTISPPHWDCGAVMMWCEILDNLQFNKFLWNEWSLIVWCEAERGAEHVIMLCHPVSNCNIFLPLPQSRPHIIRHLLFPWESVLVPGHRKAPLLRAAGPDVNNSRVTLHLHYTRTLHLHRYHGL